MGWFHSECGRGGWPRGVRVTGSRDWSFPGGNIHFEFGHGESDGGWGGGGRRAGRRMFGSGELRLVLLKLIADEPRHGYDLRRAIEDLTQGGYAPSPGALYPTLNLLEDMGLIEAQATEGARKKFAVTDDGRAFLDENSEEVERLMERLEETGTSRRRSHRPEMGRAVGNLMTALRNRIAQQGWNEDLLNDVVDILDEAAQRIERVKGARGPESSGGQ